jgi:N-formylglutamate amidohydrolase
LGNHVLLPGNPASPVLLHVPHAGREIPAWTRPHLLLDDAELAAELAALTDHHTDRIAVTAAGLAAVRPWVLVNRVSRFVVDPERFPDEREEMAAVGMAAVYTHGTRGQRVRADDPAHRDALVAAFHTTWADTVTELVEARLAATGRAVLLDVHSYPADPLPYELHADGPRPAVCLGTDPVHTPPDLLDAAREAFAGIGAVDVDTPFRGVYVPLRHYGVDPRVQAVMLELRRDGHRDEPGLAAAAGALATLVNRAYSR